jgi:DNA repair protein RadA/Sms
MYICSDCWNESIKWTGQCSFCKAWWTLKEFKETKVSWNTPLAKWEAKNLQKISEIKKDKNLEKIITKSTELNTVLGWWIIPGWITLLTWEPWIWKSTITLQLASWVENKKIIYISGEETEYQIGSRAERLWVKNDNLLLLSESNIENILETLTKNQCDILIIDSISVIHSNSISWVAWSISQVRYISELLTNYWKVSNTSVFIIGHINKEWTIAWPKTLEHMVDTVLFFEWEKYDNLRILRALKNRFWNTSEIGLFKMLENWLQDLENPWLEFINNSESTIWSSLSITIEWTRALIIETESLTTYTKFGYPKRSTRWINTSKLDLIIAVLWKYSNISLDSYDVYINISRWLRIDEPWIDLSIASSIISSKLNKQIPKNIIFVWEISLTWNIKKPIHLEKRIKEAEKMWFKKIYIPKSNIKSKDIELIQLKNIWDLVKEISKL